MCLGVESVLEGGNSLLSLYFEFNTSGNYKLTIKAFEEGLALWKVFEQSGCRVIERHCCHLNTCFVSGGEI